jgi:hypothetical protein
LSTEGTTCPMMDSPIADDLYTACKQNEFDFFFKADSGR